MNYKTVTETEAFELINGGKAFRNAAEIRKSATCIIRGSVPLEVRQELSAAVRVRLLGRFKKDGLKPEIYFHPDHKHLAKEMQTNEALFAIECIRKVLTN